MIVTAGFAIVAAAAAAVGCLYSLDDEPKSVAASVAIVITLCAWLARLLFLAVRGRLPEDMVRFALTDPFGVLLLAFLAALWFMAA